MRVSTPHGLLAWLMRRVGFLGWTSLNPYEIEARAAESKTT